MARPLNKIAAEIHLEWWPQLTDKSRPIPRYMVNAMPYLEAMLNMNSISESYGLEEGVFVVLYFLNNVIPWRGEKARLIKLELNLMVKEHNARHNGV